MGDEGSWRLTFADDASLPVETVLRRVGIAGYAKESSSLPFCRLLSLAPPKNSLIRKIIFLLVCVGNFVKTRCGTAVASSETVFGSPNIAKFPARREMKWRRVRSALHRQPELTSHIYFVFLNAHSEWMLPGRSPAYARVASGSLIMFA
jgi:hypothetical protein